MSRMESVLQCVRMISLPCAHTRESNVRKIDGEKVGGTKNHERKTGFELIELVILARTTLTDFSLFSRKKQGFVKFIRFEKCKIQILIMNLVRCGSHILPRNVNLRWGTRSLAFGRRTEEYLNHWGQHLNRSHDRIKDSRRHTDLAFLVQVVLMH